MAWEWMLNPIAAGALPAAGLLLCLYLFASVKRELHQAAGQWAKTHDELNEKVRALEGELEKIKNRLDELVALTENRIEPAWPAGGINLNKRVQALRMYRKGDAPETIAAALMIPRQEVELLLKVEQAAADLPPSS